MTLERPRGVCSTLTAVTTCKLPLTSSPTNHTLTNKPMRVTNHWYIRAPALTIAGTVPGARTLALGGLITVQLVQFVQLRLGYILKRFNVVVELGGPWMESIDVHVGWTMLHWIVLLHNIGKIQ